MQLKTSRFVDHIQVHCTWRPNYSNFNGKNHQAVFDGIKRYHTVTNGWKDIGYHFLVFPDGIIMSGRSLDLIPAGIKNHNTGGIAIAFVGDFNKNADVMKPDQLLAGIYLIGALILKHRLTTKDVIYHNWKDPDKLCPGSNFLKAGNSPNAYENSLKKLLDQNLINIKNYI